MITCVGNPVFDRIKTLRIESPGRVLSGCSTNACLALAKLGQDTTLVGRVGAEFDESFRVSMDRYGIHYFIEQAPQSGGFQLVYYDDQGNRTLDLLGDAGAISFFPEACARSDWILFGPILREIDLDYVRMVKSKSAAKLFVDPQGFIRSSRNGRIEHGRTDEVEELASLSQVFKPNEMECQVLTGIDPRVDYVTPAQMIKSWGADLVILTLAEQGSVIFDGSEFYRIPPFITDALDSTGAGDTYAAGIIYALEQGYDYFEAGCFAASVAAIMIENCGPDFPLTLAEAVGRKEQLLRQYAGQPE